MFLRTMKYNPVNSAESASKKVNFRPNAPFLRIHLRQRNLRRTTASDNRRDILRTRPVITLLCSAVKQRCTLCPAPQIESTNALRPAEFMRRKGKSIHLQRIHIEGNMSSRLHRIRMKRNAACAQTRTDLRNRLDGSDLIVRRHDADKRRIGTECRLDVIGINHPLIVNRN